MVDNPLVVAINRPQYVANPDLLLVSLANRMFDVPKGPNEAFIYRDQRTKAGATSIKYVETYPGRPANGGKDAEHFESWVRALVTAGLETESVSDSAIAAQGIASSMISVAAGKARSIGALPVTIHSSLLQDRRGVVGVKNPPDYGQILEQLFCLGTTHESCASELWHGAALRRIETDPLARVIDEAVRVALLPEGVTQASPDRPVPSAGVGQMVHEWSTSSTASNSYSNPMIWFANRWEGITAALWVDSLPSRRWVDWASTVLRHAFAFGFLWEARYYRKLAEACLDRSIPINEEFFRLATNSRRGLLSWKDLGLAPSVRSISARQAVIDGMRAREFFAGLDHPSIVESDPIATLERVRSVPERVDQLREILSRQKDSRSVNNVWEAIRYALLVREPEPGGPPDHYGLLRGTRWLCPDPGAEWIVVMASLRAGVGQKTTVGEVLDDLNCLGIDISLPELLRLVERCGLADLSADADMAVVVESAFGKVGK